MKPRTTPIIFLTDNRRVECAKRINDNIAWYVDMLESIPVEEGSWRHADSWFHRLELRQHATGWEKEDANGWEAKGAP